MADFYQTRIGRQFFDSDVPGIRKALERIAVALEKLVDQKSTPDDNTSNAPLTDALKEC